MHASFLKKYKDVNYLTWSVDKGEQSGFPTKMLWGGSENNLTQNRCKWRRVAGLNIEENWLMSSILRRTLRCFGHAKCPSGLERTTMESVGPGHSWSNEDQCGGGRGMLKTPWSLHEAEGLTANRESFGQAVKRMMFTNGRHTWRQWIPCSCKRRSSLCWIRLW